MTQVLLTRLDDIRESVQRIASYTAGMSLDAFRVSQLTLDAVIRNLRVIGEVCKQLPDQVRNHEPDVEWRKFAEMGDKLINQYFDVDTDTVWNIVQNSLPKLDAAAQRLLAEFPDPDESES